MDVPNFLDVISVVEPKDIDCVEVEDEIRTPNVILDRLMDRNDGLVLDVFASVPILVIILARTYTKKGTEEVWIEERILCFVVVIVSCIAIELWD